MFISLANLVRDELLYLAVFETFWQTRRYFYQVQILNVVPLTYRDKGAYRFESQTSLQREKN